jgi:hypothetical protein
MKTEECKTYWARIYGCGDMADVKRACRSAAQIGEEGEPQNCVNIHASDYIYKGGEESGFVVELINYPRFPSSQREIFQAAERLSKSILDYTYQHSILIMTPDKTVWFTKRK